MKKRRVLLIFTLLIFVSLFFLLSSPIFKLQKVEVVFYDLKNNKVNLVSNSVYNSPDKVEKILSSTNFAYGQSLFLLDKNSYSEDIERKNPYIEMIKILSVFPNKIVLNVRERTPRYYIKGQNKLFLLDVNFKLLEITKSYEKLSSMIEISANKNSYEENFFNFFELSDKTYEVGQSFCENNIAVTELKNTLNSLDNLLKELNLTQNNFFSKISLAENSTGTLSFVFKTKSAPYGVVLVLEDALKNSTKKVKKLFNAFKTLEVYEKIKTTYGQLKIDNNFNCYWNNL